MIRGGERGFPSKFLKPIRISGISFAKSTKTPELISFAKLGSIKVSKVKVPVAKPTGIDLNCSPEGMAKDSNPGIA